MKLGLVCREKKKVLKNANVLFGSRSSSPTPIRSAAANGPASLFPLIVDPTIYERLSAILDSSGRRCLLRSLIRGLGRDQSVDGKP